MREPIPVWCFAITVVRDGDRYLLVREPDYNDTWYLPGGRVEIGETPAEAAIREAFEEAGIRIRLDGVIRVEFSPDDSEPARSRFFFLGSPVHSAQKPESAKGGGPEIAWVGAHEVEGLNMRHHEAADVIRAVASGCPIAPLDLVTIEGEPFHCGETG